MTATGFGQYLKKIRKDRNMSVNQLATYSGISNAQISRIENGLRNAPKPETIKKLSQALKVDYQEMMQVAGYTEETEQHYIPEWATSKDKRDFKKMLEEDEEVMFDGVPIDEESREKIKRVMEAIFWDAKKQNKRKPLKDK